MRAHGRRSFHAAVASRAKNDVMQENGFLPALTLQPEVDTTAVCACGQLRGPKTNGSNEKNRRILSTQNTKHKTLAKTERVLPALTLQTEGDSPERVFMLFLWSEDHGELHPLDFSCCIAVPVPVSKRTEEPFKRTPPSNQPIRRRLGGRKKK